MPHDQEIYIRCAMMVHYPQIKQGDIPCQQNIKDKNCMTMSINAEKDFDKI